MCLPPGIEMKLRNNKVRRLKKSSHGLEQSPRAWFGCFGKIITSYRYQQSQSDHTIFYNTLRIIKLLF